MVEVDGKNAKALRVLSSPEHLSSKISGAPHSSTSVVSKSGAKEQANLYVEGIIAGIIGASLIALWFFFWDLMQGQMFRTPFVLGAALFAARDLISSSDHLHPFRAIVMYTWVHFLVFAVVGGVASWLLNFAEKNPNLGFGILLLFVVLELFFISATYFFASPVLGLLAWPAVVIGNLLAATGMGIYLWYRHPSLMIKP